MIGTDERWCTGEGIRGCCRRRIFGNGQDVELGDEGDSDASISGHVGSWVGDVLVCGTLPYCCCREMLLTREDFPFVNQFMFFLNTFALSTKAALVEFIEFRLSPIPFSRQYVGPTLFDHACVA